MPVGAVESSVLGATLQSPRVSGAEDQIEVQWDEALELPGVNDQYDPIAESAVYIALGRPTDAILCLRQAALEAPDDIRVAHRLQEVLQLFPIAARRLRNLERRIRTQCGLNWVLAGTAVGLTAIIYACSPHLPVPF